MAEPMITSGEADTAFDVLIRALQTTGKPVPMAVAEKLMTRPPGASEYDLHLRNAQLDSADIHNIAEAIKAVDDSGGPSLRSFSLSYNQRIADAEIRQLAESLPLTVTEIGMVQTGMTDIGGRALIDWAQGAPDLRWFCIEENSISAEFKTELKKFSQGRPGLLVVY